MSCPFCLHKPHRKSDPGSHFPPAPWLRDWDRHGRVQGHVPSWGAHFHPALSHLLPGHVNSELHQFRAINTAAPNGTSSSRAGSALLPGADLRAWMQSPNTAVSPKSRTAHCIVTTRCSSISLCSAPSSVWSCSIHKHVHSPLPARGDPTARRVPVLGTEPGNHSWALLRVTRA